MQRGMQSGWFSPRLDAFPQTAVGPQSTEVVQFLVQKFPAYGHPPGLVSCLQTAPAPSAAQSALVLQLEPKVAAARHAPPPSEAAQVWDAEHGAHTCPPFPHAF